MVGWHHKFGRLVFASSDKRVMGLDDRRLYGPGQSEASCNVDLCVYVVFVYMTKHISLKKENVNVS